ncbi:hypothetical protein OAK43_01695 [Verrucomicrobiales bacterium]|nr:hypothetical protein [Verrucomicrobiales bacterium]
MKPNPEKEALLRSLETSRRQISGDVGEVGHRLNVPERFRQSVSENSFKWIGGCIAVGVAMAIVSPAFFRRRPSKAEKTKRGIMGTAFLGLIGIAGKQILRASLPSIQKVAQDGLQQWYVTRFGDMPENAQPPEMNIED